MSKDSKQLDNTPLFYPCNPLQREFPAAWREIKFRRESTIGKSGQAEYECPLCKKKFDHSNFDQLQGDHIWPYSFFGETSWCNYQLLCGTCNTKKSNIINSDIRKVLGQGEFRNMVIEFLSQALANNDVTDSNFLRQMLDQKLYINLIDNP